MLDKELRPMLRNMIHYIKNVEEAIDGEFGSCRDFDEILMDGHAPEVYYQIIAYLREGESE